MHDALNYMQQLEYTGIDVAVLLLRVLGGKIVGFSDRFRFKLKLLGQIFKVQGCGLSMSGRVGFRNRHQRFGCRAFLS